MESTQSVATVLFSEDKKSVLLIKRRDVPVWVLPGGGIDPKEKSKEAAEREMKEETGLFVQATRLIGDYSPINRLAKRTDVFECVHISGELSLSEETADISFFPLDKLPPMPPPYLEWIFDAKQNQAPLQKKLTSVNYLTLIKYFLSHPILVSRFILSRAGIAINSKQK